MKIIKITEKTEKLINKNRTYHNSFGSGGTKIGSLGVVTINLPRVAYKNVGNVEGFIEDIKRHTNDAARINNAKRNIIQKRIDNGNLPLYTLGFIDIKKQYSTCGICGLNEAVQIMGYNILEKDGQDFVIKILDAINETNDRAERQFGAPHNCEQIPGESSAVKLAEKDKLLKYQTPEHSYDLYSNQFIPLTTQADLLDRIKLQGMFDKHFSGGAICHLNIDTRLNDKEKMKNLIKTAARAGVIYFAVNYNLQECENGHLTVGKNEICDCGAPIVENYTRVVGYLVKVNSWNKTRRTLDYNSRQFYHDV